MIRVRVRIIGYRVGARFRVMVSSVRVRVNVKAGAGF